MAEIKESKESVKEPSKKAAKAVPQQAPRSNSPYEGMFLLSPAASTDAEAGLNLVRGIIERHGGQVLVIKKWDERKLAYEIAGQKRGTYVLTYFSAPGTAITPIKRDVELGEEILRVLVLKADHVTQEEIAAAEPQPIQVREERPFYDRPYGDRPSFDRGGERPAFDRGGDRGPERSDRPAPRAPRRDEGAPASGDFEKD